MLLCGEGKTLGCRGLVAVLVDQVGLDPLRDLVAGPPPKVASRNVPDSVLGLLILAPPGSIRIAKLNEGKQSLPTRG